MVEKFGPSDFTVSWIRAYSCLQSPREILELRNEPDRARAYFGDDLVGISEGDDAFWDVQTILRHQVARVQLGGLRVRLEADDEDWWPVQVHLLFHVSGFMVMRLTIRHADRPDARQDGLDQWQRFGQLPWGAQKLHWEKQLYHLFSRPAGVREMMDIIFHDMHERMHRRVPSRYFFDNPWEYNDRYVWFDERVCGNELHSAYPVTFGTSFETVWAGDPSEGDIERAAWLATPDRDELSGGDVLEEHDDHWWFWGENAAVLVIPDSHLPSGGTRLDAIDPIRTQLVEYMTLQRGALRTVQRATQLAISERTHVSRRDVARWSRVVAAVSDDYVLHDQVAARLEPLRLHLRHNPTLRDPEQLAAQVRANLASFEGLISTASNRAGIVLSALFGLIAATTAAPVVHEVAYYIAGGTGGVDAYSADHPGLMVALDVGTLIVLAVFAVTCFLLFVTRVRTQR